MSNAASFLSHLLSRGARVKMLMYAQIRREKRMNICIISHLKHLYSFEGKECGDYGLCDHAVTEK